MAGKQFTNILMLEARFNCFPKRFAWDGKLVAVKSVIQTWTVNSGANPHQRFLVVLESGEQANIYKFILPSGDLWKLDVTDAKAEA